MEAASHLPAPQELKEEALQSGSIFRGFLLNSAVELILPTQFEGAAPEGATTQTSARVFNLDREAPLGYWHDF